MSQDAVHAKGRASAALQQAQQQLDQSSEHLTLLKKQLAEERLSDAALSANLDSVQAELAQCKTQVDHCLHQIARGSCPKVPSASLPWSSSLHVVSVKVRTSPVLPVCLFCQQGSLPKCRVHHHYAVALAGTGVGGWAG